MGLGNNEKACLEAIKVPFIFEGSNRKKSKMAQQGHKSHTILTQDSFLVFLLVLPVELWNGLLDETTIKYKENRGALTAFQTGCLGALHGSQSLTVLNS